MVLGAEESRRFAVGECVAYSGASFLTLLDGIFGTGFCPTLTEEDACGDTDIWVVLDTGVADFTLLATVVVAKACWLRSSSSGDEAERHLNGGSNLRCRCHSCGSLMWIWIVKSTARAPEALQAVPIGRLTIAGLSDLSNH
jgi:hypothetical protein